MKPIIEVNHLYKKYRIGERQRYYSFRDTIVNLAKSPFRQKNKLRRNEFWALKDISFKVMPGEVLGIIGRNGAGKTTILRILSQITPPTKGEAILRGRVASLLEVGTGFHPELTGRENIYLNGAILGMRGKEVKEKFNQIVEFAEIEKFLDTPVKHYSSGMYMRLAFAVAAHLEPEILLVDEVLAVGDINFRKKCLGKMKEVSMHSGRTILFVSHDMSAIQNLCNKAILLKGGKVNYIGTAVDAVKKYVMETDYRAAKEKLEWVPPKKNYPYPEVVKIKRFYIVDDSGTISSGKLCNSKTYEAIIEADLIQSNASLVFSIFFYDDMKNLIFFSDMCDTGMIDFSQIKPGQIKLSVSIPVEILANRTYEIELVCCLHMVGWVLSPHNESSLRINFFRDVDTNTYFNSAARGLIAPVLAWKFEYEKNN